MGIPFDQRIVRLKQKYKAAIDRENARECDRLEAELDAAFGEFDAFHAGTKSLIRDFASLASSVLSDQFVDEMKKKCLRSSIAIKKHRTEYSKLRRFRGS